MTRKIEISEFTPDSFTEAMRGIVREELRKITDSIQPKPLDELMTRKEVAKYLSVDESTVHRWTRKGILNAKGIGFRVYYRRSDVEQAIKAI